MKTYLIILLALTNDTVRLEAQIINLLKDLCSTLIFISKLRYARLVFREYLAAECPEIRVQRRIQRLRESVIIIRILLGVSVQININRLTKLFHVIDSPLAVVHYIVKIVEMIILSRLLIIEITIRTVKRRERVIANREDREIVTVKRFLSVLHNLH